MPMADNVTDIMVSAVVRAEHGARLRTQNPTIRECNMKRILTELALVAAILCLTATMNAFADERGEAARHKEGHGPRHHPGTMNMDANHDGKVTFAEFRAAHLKRLKTRFERLDKNGDGVISRADRDAARREHADRFFERADKNGDGLLSREELRAARHAGHRPR